MWCVACGLAHTQLHDTRIPDGGNEEIRLPHGYRPFYSYYQISRDSEPDAPASEPEKEGGELKSQWEGSHSPFGFLWQIASATGWTVDYILNGVNYQTLIMMLSDAPRYVDKNDKNKKENQTAEEEANEIVGFFQSKLNE